MLKFPRSLLSLRRFHFVSALKDFPLRCVYTRPFCTCGLAAGSLPAALADNPPVRGGSDLNRGQAKLRSLLLRRLHFFAHRKEPQQDWSDEIQSHGQKNITKTWLWSSYNFLFSLVNAA
ncbi:hypothetical protein ANANG_G00176090 [Anguilla anguilla]|uniref:Uncharacterized protein n=1 Tax=Anguilla anguilla TaxID=7936 RepID=A0A0E9X3Z5_ANGAN|nr:hypothetical protein ANANG_G00176090 [Anguilla anguilla]